MVVYDEQKSCQASWHLRKIKWWNPPFPIAATFAFLIQKYKRRPWTGGKMHQEPRALNMTVEVVLLWILLPKSSNISSSDESCELVFWLSWSDSCLYCLHSLLALWRVHCLWYSYDSLVFDLPELYVDLETSRCHSDGAFPIADSEYDQTITATQMRITPWYVLFSGLTSLTAL
jgi:hypothetical protein